MTASELAAIPVKRRVTLIFMLSGVFAALGAIVLFSRITTASRFWVRTMTQMQYWRSLSAVRLWLAVGAA